MDTVSAVADRFSALFLLWAVGGLQAADLVGLASELYGSGAGER